jgi:hypothetical protein
VCDDDYSGNSSFYPNSLTPPWHSSSSNKTKQKTQMTVTHALSRTSKGQGGMDEKESHLNFRGFFSFKVLKFSEKSMT